MVEWQCVLYGTMILCFVMVEWHVLNDDVICYL